MKWFNFEEKSTWRGVVWSLIFVVGVVLIFLYRIDDNPALMILAAPFLAGLGFAPDKADATAVKK
jgi:drug/metabolite transporter (DMT)-like permease